jgi:hypothetical protein
VRAEIIIQPEEGRWVFTPNELSGLAQGLESVLLNSNPERGWPFRLTLKQYVGLFSPLVAFEPPSRLRKTTARYSGL